MIQRLVILGLSTLAFSGVAAESTPDALQTDTPVIAPAPPATPPTARITVFTLKDGKTVEALRFSKVQSDSTQTYSVVSLDGRRLNLTDEQLASKVEKDVPFDTLPESARASILASRSQILQQDARKKTQNSGQRGVLEAKIRENEASNAVKKANLDLATALNAKPQLAQIIEKITLDMAKAKAEYDAAQAEMISGGSVVAVSRTPAALRQVMIQSQEKQQRLQIDKANAERELANVDKSIGELTQNVAKAEKHLEECKAATQVAFAKAKALAN